MKRFTFALILLPATVMFLSACTGYSVKSDFDETKDYNAYRSFAWKSEDPLTVSSDKTINPILGTRIQRAVENVIREKGFNLADSPNQADLLIGLSLGSKDGSRYRPSGFSIGFGARSSNVLLGTGIGSYDYTEGSLSIDFFDAQTQQPIWHGTADKNFIGIKADDSQDKVYEVVRAILEKYPPI